MLSIQTDKLLEFIRKGNLSETSQLLAKEPALANAKDKDGVSFILVAFYNGHPDIARAIGAAKPELDIFEAAVLGNMDRVQALIGRNHSLVTGYSPDGFPALALAAYLGQKEVTEYLITNGADVNAIAKNPTGFTALTGAVANNHTEISKILVHNGANVNHRYEEGASPLMEASHNGNVELVRFLLEKGADPKARTKDGKTPLSFAKEKNHSEVIALLSKHGASL